MSERIITKTHETTQQLNRSHGSFELALTPVILGLLGLWLDRTVGTVPVFVITFTLLGFVGAGIKLYYSYRFEMAQLETGFAWRDHESTADFRRHSAELVQQRSAMSALSADDHSDDSAVAS